MSNSFSVLKKQLKMKLTVFRLLSGHRAIANTNDNDAIASTQTTTTPHVPLQHLPAVPVYLLQCYCNLDWLQVIAFPSCFVFYLV